MHGAHGVVRSVDYIGGSCLATVASARWLHDGHRRTRRAPRTEVAGPAASQRTTSSSRCLLHSDFGDLSLLYAITVFGAPRDVTLDEIAIETFFPADAATATLLRTATTT